MDQAERLALARQLVDALERGAQDAADHCLQTLSDHRGSQLLRHVAEVTRDVHQAFGGVVSDQRLYEISKHAMPDARERLSYVVEKSEESAHRTLSAVEAMLPLAERLCAHADGEVSAAGTRLRAGLTDVLMAQEYQDLTGQVIKKIVDLAQSMETQLLQVLIEAMPPDMKAGAPEGLMNGPAMNAAGRTDVVNNQEQVDDLLESLGF